MLMLIIGELIAAVNFLSRLIGLNLTFGDWSTKSSQRIKFLRPAPEIGLDDLSKRQK